MMREPASEGGNEKEPCFPAYPTDQPKFSGSNERRHMMAIDQRACTSWHDIMTSRLRSVGFEELITKRAASKYKAPGECCNRCEPRSSSRSLIHHPSRQGTCARRKCKVNLLSLKQRGSSGKTREWQDEGVARRVSRSTSHLPASLARVNFPFPSSLRSSV